MGKLIDISVGTRGSSRECVGDGKESGRAASPVITPRSINLM